MAQHGSTSVPSASTNRSGCGTHTPALSFPNSARPWIIINKLKKRHGGQVATRGQLTSTSAAEGDNGSGDDGSEAILVSAYEALKQGIRHILDRREAALSYEQLYRCSYLLVLNRQGESLYKELAELLREWLQNNVVERLLQEWRCPSADCRKQPTPSRSRTPPASSANGTTPCGGQNRSASTPEGESTAPIDHGRSVVKTVATTWLGYCAMLRTIAGVLMYLDRNFCAVRRWLPTTSLGLLCFRSIVLEHELVREKLVHAMLEIVMAYRASSGRACSDDPSSNDMTTLVRMFHEVDVDCDNSGGSGNNSLLAFGRNSPPRDDSGVGHLPFWIKLHGRMAFYGLYFERPLVDKTAAYFREEANRELWAAPPKSASAYVERVDMRLAREHSLIQTLLDGRSEKVLPECIIGAYFAPEIAQALVSHPSLGCEALLKAGDTKGIRKLVSRLQQTQPTALEQMRGVFESYLLSTGKNTISACISKFQRRIGQQAIAIIAGLIDLRVKCSNIIQEGFLQLEDFQIACDSVFREILRQLGDYTGSSHAHASSKLVAVYLDYYVRKSSFLLECNDNSEGNFGQDSWLSAKLPGIRKIQEALKLIRLLPCIEDFEPCYRDLLSRRLLSYPGGVSIRLEQVILENLLQISTDASSSSSGSSLASEAFATKMEVMLEDYSRSHRYSVEFAALAAETATKQTFDFAVTVLTAGQWVLDGEEVKAQFARQADTNEKQPAEFAAFLLPPQVASAFQNYEAFYLARQSGRRLSFLPFQGTVELDAYFPSGTYRLLVTPIIAAVLLRFNDFDSISFETLADLLGMQTRHDHLGPHLQPLLSGVRSSSASSAIPPILQKIPSRRSSCSLPSSYFKQDNPSPSAPASGFSPGTAENSNQVLKVNVQFRAAATVIRLAPHKPRPRSMSELVDAILMNPASQQESPNRHILDTTHTKATPCLGSFLGPSPSDNYSSSPPVCRDAQIDAALVRICKQWQTISHVALVDRCMRSLQPWFAATSSSVAERIKALVDKQYLERSPQDPFRYSYVP